VLRNLLAPLLGAILLILGFMFSLVILAVGALLGLGVWGYLWWKTRKLRRTMREQAAGGQVIEGESAVIEEYRVATENVLPGSPSGQHPSTQTKEHP
jgi:hypothetical protein